MIDGFTDASKNFYRKLCFNIQQGENFFAFFLGFLNAGGSRVSTSFPHSLAYPLLFSILLPSETKHL